MTTKDKVAIILSQRGFSLAEGMEMYDQLKADEGNQLIKVDPEKDVAVWLECGWSDGDMNTVHVMVWLNYKKDFCLNYTLAGAVALHDSDLSLKDEDTAKLMDFFRQCRKSDYTAPAPVIPHELEWIFTYAQLTDYMEADEYEVNDSTEIELNVR